MKRKIITALGWLLQVWAVLWLIAVLYFVLFVRPPTESTPDVVKSKYEEIISDLGSYDALLWVGVFFFGRWMTKRNKKRDVEPEHGETTQDSALGSTDS